LLWRCPSRLAGLDVTSLVRAAAAAATLAPRGRSLDQNGTDRHRGDC